MHVMNPWLVLNHGISEFVDCLLLVIVKMAMIRVRAQTSTK